MPNEKTILLTRTRKEAKELAVELGLKNWCWCQLPTKVLIIQPVDKEDDE